jgi:hypothetical protein
MIVDKTSIITEYKLINDKKKVKPWLAIFYDAHLLKKLVTTHFCHPHIFVDKIWILSDISGLSKKIRSVVVYSVQSISITKNKTKVKATKKQT